MNAVLVGFVYINGAGTEAFSTLLGDTVQPTAARARSPDPLELPARLQRIGGLALIIASHSPKSRPVNDITTPQAPASPSPAARHQGAHSTTPGRSSSRQLTFRQPPNTVQNGQQALQEPGVGPSPAAGEALHPERSCCCAILLRHRARRRRLLRRQAPQGRKELPGSRTGEARLPRGAHRQPCRQIPVKGRQPAQIRRLADGRPPQVHPTVLRLEG